MIQTIVTTLIGLVLVGSSWLGVYIWIERNEPRPKPRRVGNCCPTCGADQRHFRLDRRARP